MADLTRGVEEDPILAPLQLEGLTIKPAGTVTEDDQVHLRLDWKGQSGGRNPSATLLPYFRSVLDAAAGLGRLTVDMHFEEMDFLNSVTVAALIRVIEEARRRQVPLIFFYDHAVKWQELNFRAVRVFAKGDGLFRLREV
jgi:hypothetical protein